MITTVMIAASAILAQAAGAAPIIGNGSATFSWSATAAVPEPMTLGILGMGLAGFGVLHRRRAV